MIPKTLKINDYKNEEVFSSMIIDQQKRNNFLKDNEFGLRKKVFNIAILASTKKNINVKDLNYSDYVSLTNNVIDNDNLDNLKNYELYNDMMNIEIDSKFFCYWKPENADKYHIKYFFGFFVRINVILHLLKLHTNNIIFLRYLKQIYSYSIPYILKIELFYYDKDIVDKVLFDYENNFKLEYEFSFRSIKYMKNQTKLFEIDHVPTPPEIKNIKFLKVYRNLSRRNENSYFMKKKTLYKLMKNLNFKKIKMKVMIKDYKVAYTLFYLLNRYYKNFPKTKYIYQIIPLLFYFTEVNNESCICSDKEFDDDIVNNLMFFPKERRKKSNVFNLSNNMEQLSYALITNKQMLDSLDNNTLNNLVIKTFFHVLPFYYSIRSFEKNFKGYYFSNDEYSYLLDEMVICTVMGFYKWSYVDCKLIDTNKRFLQLITKHIDFYKTFILQKKKNRFEYIKKTFIDKGYLKYIIQEYIVYIIIKNNDFYKGYIKWSVIGKKKTPKRNLTLNTFINCVKLNCNLLRMKLFSNNNIKEKFIDTRRRKNKEDRFNIIYKHIQSLKEKSFFIKTIFNRRLPSSFGFILSIKNFDVADFDKFWDYYQYKSPEDLQIYTSKTFRVSKEDSRVIIGLLLIDKLQTNNDILKNIKEMSQKMISLLYYLIWVYNERYKCFQISRLSLNELLYHRLLESYENHDFLKFSFSYCCKKNHNSLINLGYNKVSIGYKNSSFTYNCTNHKKKRSNLDDSKKYSYFLEESRPYINKFANFFFNNKMTFDYYKNILFEEGEEDGNKNSMIDEGEEGEEDGNKNSMIDEGKEGEEDSNKNSMIDEEEEEEEEVEVPHNDSFYNLLLPCQRLILENNKSKNLQKRCAWEYFPTKDQCEKLFFKNLYMYNEVKRFLKKMCKWSSMSELTKWKLSNKHVKFFDSTGNIFTEYQQKSNVKKYVSLKLCCDCKKICEFNKEKQADFYTYCCKECESALNKDVDVYKKIAIIDSEEEYDLFKFVTQ